MIWLTGAVVPFLKSGIASKDLPITEENKPFIRR